MNIQINYRSGTILADVILWEKRGEDVVCLTFEKDTITEHRVEYGAATTPDMVWMTLRMDMLQDLTKAFMEYGAKKGIELDSESRAKGKLEAQSEHLKDLRQLLKLK